MAAAELLAELTADGFSISVSGRQLIVSPASGLFSHQRELIRLHIAALIALIDPDPRVTCNDCAHYRPHRCANWRAARLPGADVGPDLAAMRQHCPGWQAERRCGDLLRVSAERGERATRDGNVNPSTRKVSDDTTPCPPTLADMGLTRDESSRYCEPNQKGLSE